MSKKSLIHILYSNKKKSLNWITFLWLPLSGWFGRTSRSLLKSLGGNVTFQSTGELPESWRLLKRWVWCNKICLHSLQICPRCCQKWRRFVRFSTCFKDGFKMVSVPLKPFLGNRFNVLFAKSLGYIVCLRNYYIF